MVADYMPIEALLHTLLSDSPIYIFRPTAKTVEIRPDLGSGLLPDGEVDRIRHCTLLIHVEPRPL